MRCTRVPAGVSVGLVAITSSVTRVLRRQTPIVTAASGVAVQRRLLQALQQLGDRLEDAGGTGLAQLLLGEPAGEERDRRDTAAPRGLAVPGGVADHHGVPPA